MKKKTVKIMKVEIKGEKENGEDGWMENKNNERRREKRWVVKIDGFMCARKHKVIKTKRRRRRRIRKKGRILGSRWSGRKFYEGCE